MTPALASPKVIINARTGSVVMNQSVTVDACAVAHGNLSVVISAQPVIRSRRRSLARADRGSGAGRHTGRAAERPARRRARLRQSGPISSRR